MASPEEIKKEIEMGLRPDPRLKGSPNEEPTTEELLRYLPKEFLQGVVVGGFGAPVIDAALLRKAGVNLGGHLVCKVDLDKLGQSGSQDERINEVYEEAKRKWRADRARLKKGRF